MSVCSYQCSRGSTFQLGSTMWSCKHLAWFLVVGFSAVQCRTIYLELAAPSSDEISFMKKYGYLPEEQGEAEFSFTPESLSEAVRKVQAFAGLPQTGAMDVETKELFRKKRCGVKDIESSNSSRARRYIIQQGWDKRTITYRVVNGSSTLAQDRVEALAAQALAVWAPHGGLQFLQLDSGKADIMVSFAGGDHGDGFPFDGQGRVVAHAFPPPHGALHFDDDEIWGDNVDSLEEDEDITDFFAVAVHEIGHALGLSHSDVDASVMFPYYKPGVEKLHMDDILGMQELYLKDKPADGDLAVSTSPGTPATPEVPRFTKADSEEEENYYPDLCMTNYDTLQVIHGKIYVFEEEWVWVLKKRNELEEGYPRRFHDVFRGLPARIAVIKTIYEKFNGNVVIFSGRNFWEFDPTFRLLKRGNISKYSIPKQVPELTTVFTSNYNNKTYLIEEERFWRYDERNNKMDKGYPKDMSAWRRVPYPVDAAIIWEGDTFFFQGPRYWRFDNDIVAAHEYYPLPVAQIWFACEPNAEMNRYVTNDGP